MIELSTARMRLIASTADLVRSEIGDRSSFGRMVGAQVPPDWPPAEAADALPWFLERLEKADPQDAGWYGFYGVAVDMPEHVLVAGGGSLGPPADGSAEVGYSVLPAFQRRGYGLEMMTAVVDWIRNDPRVREIVAETDADNMPSRGLLARLGFAEVGPGRDARSLRYARTS
jgi:RimJ/RimL family protein N-acetyltransferase